MNTVPDRLPPHPMDKEAAKRMLDEIKRNRDRLDACPQHDFGELPNPPRFGQKLICTRCIGQMDAVQAFRYCQGFAAAGGDPNEVIRNFGPQQTERLAKTATLLSSSPDV